LCRSVRPAPLTAAAGAALPLGRTPAARTSDLPVIHPRTRRDASTRASVCPPAASTPWPDRPLVSV
jgi:hypothetical protein